MNNILRVVLILCVALHLQHALADDKNPPGKKWKERPTERNIDAGRIGDDTAGPPGWLDDKEKKEDELTMEIYRALSR